MRSFIGWNALLRGSEVHSICWEVSCNKIQYNTLFFIHFSWSSWGGHSHAQLYKYILVHRADDRLIVDWYFSAEIIILWEGWSSAAMMYISNVFISWIYIAARMDETRSGVFNLFRSSNDAQVDPCENFLKSNMERHRLITGQWCKPLTSARGITDKDDDPQGTVVQFTWWE